MFFFGAGSPKSLAGQPLEIILSAGPACVRLPTHRDDLLLVIHPHGEHNPGRRSVG